MPVWRRDGEVQGGGTAVLPRGKVDVGWAAPVGVGLVRARREEAGLLQLWVEAGGCSKTADCVAGAVVAAGAVPVSCADPAVAAFAIKHRIACWAP